MFEMFRQSLGGVETIYVKVEDESEEEKINEDTISSNDVSRRRPTSLVHSQDQV